MEEDFVDQLRDGNFAVGKAVEYSKIYRVSDTVLRLAHNLLGDPLLEMWTDIPQYYGNITISRTDNFITVAGVNEDSTIVAYYSNDGRIGRKTVSAGSITLTGISPNSTIMLYKHNYIPYIAPLLLQNVNIRHPQYVIASDVTAGKSIDGNRTNGNVTIHQGIEYEIEASGVVKLEDGFKVEKGATFAVYPSTF